MWTREVHLPQHTPPPCIQIIALSHLILPTTLAEGSDFLSNPPFIDEKPVAQRPKVNCLRAYSYLGAELELIKG